MLNRNKIRIGELLIQEELITDDQLKICISKQQTTGQKLGKILVECGYITKEQLLALLADQLHLPIIHLKNHAFDPDLTRKLPETYARRFRALLLAENSENFLLGMADPLDIFAYDELSKILNKSFDIALVPEQELLHSIDLLYRRTEEISHFAEELSGEMQRGQHDLTAGENINAEEAPVVKLLQSIFTDAIQVGASDIHIEPDQQVFRIRQRIDGILHEQIMKEQTIVSAVTQRLKLMAGLNIAEKRLPQDGRFQMHVNEKLIDVRLSTMPTQYGESVVMRLLDQSGGIIDLRQLGMPPGMLAQVLELIHRPNGIVIVTGPTGSGKTTTLYAMLNELNKPEKKIITVEDPIEYRLPRLTQVQVNPKIELSFARVLRSALRQDPDILLVGEIRDTETATITLRAAMTGHLVFATLHTNDAASTALRLIDMGIDSYLVAGTLNGIIAQRLIRKICESCKVDHELTAQEEALLRVMLPGANEYPHFKHGQGCTHCSHTGYQGRIGVYELLTMNETLLDAIRRNDHNAFMHQIQQQYDFKPLGYNAFQFALSGVATLSEACALLNPQHGY